MDNITKIRNDGVVQEMNRTCGKSVEEDGQKEEEHQTDPSPASQEEDECRPDEAQGGEENEDGDDAVVKGEEGRNPALANSVDEEDDGQKEEQRQKDPSTVVLQEGSDDDNNQNGQQEEEEDDRLCYICWEGSSNSTVDAGKDENPLRRDCGCTGSTGWVHTSCLIELAESRVQISDPLVRPWSKCSQCTQAYRDPTKSILEKALLLGDRHRWRKQILASIQLGGEALLFPCLYFGAHSALGCAVSFWLELVVATGEALQPAWEAASDHSKAAIYLVMGCLIAIPIIKCWRQIWRSFLQLATVLSTAVLFTVAVVPTDFLFPEWGTQEITMLVGGALGVLSYQAYNLYRHRGVLRHELLQVRRRGAWAALFQVAFIGTLLFLHTYIDDYIFFKYVHLRNQVDVNQMVLGIATTTTTTGRQIVPKKRRAANANYQENLEQHFHARRLFRKQTLSSLLEEMYRSIKEKEDQQHREDQFREDYLYWSCCS